MYRALSKPRTQLSAGLLVALAAAAATSAAPPLAAELSAVRAAFLQQAPSGGLVGPESGLDGLGRRMVTGDFNGDGRDDLAVGELDNDSIVLSGAVHVLYGAAAGLPGVEHVWYDFDPATLLLDREVEDFFGDALAVGDFNDDGFDDLAVGVTGEDIGAIEEAGVVLAIYGSADGLQTGTEPGTVAPRRFRLGAGGIGGGPPAANEHFGSALAAGDWDGDGRDDLAVGIPLKISGSGEMAAGSVLVLYGGTEGLAAARHAFLDQDTDIGGNPMVGTTNPSDFFGHSLAAGDFNADGLHDLAVGIPFEGGTDLPGCPGGSGAVQVIYGTLGNGLHPAGNQLWYEGNVDTGGACELNDEFGYALAAGDLTGDGADELVIGTPYEDVAALNSAGAITCLVGSPGPGLTSTFSQLHFETDLRPAGAIQDGDRFGYAVAIGDFRGGSSPERKDLAVGVPTDNVWNGFSSVDDAGSAIVVPGSLLLSAGTPQFWTLGAAGIPGAIEVDQWFGSAFAGGDFDGDGHGDLAIGVSNVDGDTANNVGGVVILRGALFADGFESEGVLAWSATAP